MDKKTGKGKQKIEMKFDWIYGNTHCYFLEREKKASSRKQLSFQLWLEQMLVLCSFHQVENPQA